MKHLQHRITLTSLALQCFLIPLVTGESFEERHRHDLATNPSDLSFTLSTTSAAGFHSGERISITLQFSSTSTDKYKLDAATYDRSGRLPNEEFVLDREDVTDPYRDYFCLGVFGGIQGGLRSVPVLGPKPSSIHLELNEWFRFDRPGRYRMYLKSHRLARERLPGETGDRATVQFAAVSNIFEIEILPQDPAWEASKLAEISGILSQPEPEYPKPGGPPVIYNPFEETLAQARRELRFLGTRAAIQLVLNRARDTNGSLDALALVGARDRMDMVARFDRFLGDSQVGFGQWDIRLRTLFTLVEKDSPEPVPIYAWQASDAAAWDSIQRTMEPRRKRFEELVHAEAVRLVPVIAQKIAPARKASAEAVAALAPAEAKAAGLIPPEDYGLTRDQLIAQFDQFPPDQQMELLGKKRDLVRGDEMIPVLRRMVEKSAPKREASGMPLEVWGVEVDLSDVALQRLYELSPQEAKALVRQDLASGNTRLAGFAVRLLPAESFPEADKALSGPLKENLPVALPLVARFATAKLVDQVQTLYKGELWPCMMEEPFTAYFVRVAPEELGRDVLHRALADREQRGCYRSLLGQVGRIVWNPVIEAETILALHDPDPEVAASAAGVLSAEGDAQVEPMLWKRLEQWSEKWKGRSDEFRGNPITGVAPNRLEEQLGRTLFDSIGGAKSWAVTEPRRKRLLALCIDDWCREGWSAQVLQARS